MIFKIFSPIRKLIIIALVAFVTTSVFSQANIKPAINLFDRQEYTECAEALEAVLRTNERDAKTNFYLGAAYVMSRKNVSDGIRRLKFSQLKMHNNDTYYYLGRAYQLQYEFEQAIASFDKYLRTAKNVQMIEQANTWRTQCQNSIPLASKLFNVRVIDKYRVTPDSLLYVYNPSKEVGVITRNSTFFESDIDPNGVLYRTERGDAIYFSHTDNNENEQLYKMEKLLDGWSDMMLLSGLESESNNKMPVMMTDGSTLYFASDRPGGMGGFDIYRTTYDLDTRTFSEPINLGVPFNSAFDDFLFVGDEFRKKAWFASNRETSTDSLVVYEILWDESVIRSFAQNTEEIRQVAKLSIDPSLAKFRDDVTAAGVRKTTFSVSKEQKKFDFIINDSLHYSQWEHFRSSEARELYRQVYAQEQKKDSLSAEMAAMRKEFTKTTSDDKRNEIISEVLKIERVVYNLEDEIKAQSDKVRKIEIAKIEQLVANGEYTSLSQVVLQSNAPKFNWDELLKPENFEMYSVVPFDEAHKQNRHLYTTVFNADERTDLLLADSLYAWAGILAIEVPRIADAEQADYIAQASAVLYCKALDQKFDIFDDRYAEIVEAEPDVDFTEVNVLRKSAVRDYALVENVRISNGLDAMQKAGVMKKRGITTYTEALNRYASHADGSFLLPQKNKSSEPMSVVTSFRSVNEETAKRGDNIFTISADDEKKIEAVVEEEKLEVKPAEVTTITKQQPQATTATTGDATQPVFGADRPVYRIQIGVFRNTPDESKLLHFDTITSVALPDKGLIKYYGGAYRTYNEAAAQLSETKASFDGAFIVAFLNGQQVKISVAQKAEK